MRMKMFYQKLLSRSALVLTLLLAFGLSLFIASGTRGQEQTNQTQTSRQRRAAGDAPPAPQSAPTPSAPGDEVQDDEVVRVETDLTNILFTATDNNKRFVTTLTRDDIRVLEDGQPQEIFTFQTQVDLPLSLAILIDTSISQERTLPEEKAAAQAFVDAIIRSGKDEAAVVSFTGDSTLEQGLTGNISRLRRAIDQIEFVPPSGYAGQGRIITNMPGGGTPPISGTNQTIAGSTAVWDAVWVTADEVLTDAADKTRRAIILVTDGDDNFSRKKIHEAIDRAVKADTLVFVIGIGDNYYRGVDEGSCRKIADNTGGRAYFPRNESDLRAAFAQIERELREQYLVAYRPTNQNRDGTFRRVQIEIVNPELRRQNLRLNYRQGYFARTVK